jgi:hypothetical protein
MAPSLHVHSYVVAGNKILGCATRSKNSAKARDQSGVWSEQGGVSHNEKAGGGLAQLETQMVRAGR